MNKLKISFLLLLIAVMPVSAFANANIVVVNNDPPNVGFNDPTPAPLGHGNNPGTTLGQLRLNAFEYAATIWEAAIDSNVEIRVRANFGPLGCTATSATLGSAGARGIWANTPNIREANTWYHVALVNKMAGVDVAPIGNTTNSDEVDLAASFNANIGTPGCLTNSGGWYYGLDTNTNLGPNGGTRINLIGVLLHEFGHGLGFSTFVNRTTGENVGVTTNPLLTSIPWPDVYEKRIFDNTQNMYWDAMVASQRLVSRLNDGNLAWAGSNVTTGAPSVMQRVGLLFVSSPSPAAGNFELSHAEFGPVLTYPPLAGQLVEALDAANPQGPSTTDGCTAILNNVSGKIAFMNRGTCGFAIKAKNAQLAGAIGVVIGDNVPSVIPADMAGSGNRVFDNTITVPAGRVTLATANLIRAGLLAGPVQVTMGQNPTALVRGTDAMGRVLLYAPATFASGSSTSHFDTRASRNLLMEPFNTANLLHSISVPQDLTLAQMRDIGWFPDADVDLVEDANDNCPNVANPNQANNDGDAQGDACDPDDDNDGVLDTADNCQFTPNSNQANNDGDAQGDVCDPDDDNDGVLDGADNCPFTANANQANYDGDGQGDACDNDDDNDGVPDAIDAYPQSDLRPTVVIGACDSGSPNALFPNGATLMDRISAITAKNHGDFVSQVSSITNEAKTLGLISGAQKGSIESCAANK